MQREENKRGTFWLHMFSGFMAGAVSRTVVAPLERIKLILQTQQIIAIPEKDKYKGFIDALRRLPKEQGISSFWRGNGTNILRIGPNIALRFAMYDKLKSFIMPKGENFNIFRRLFAGFMSGVVAILFTYPFDVVRVRLSLDMGTLEGQKQYKGFKHCLKVMINNEGILSIYKGFFMSLIGLAPYLSIAFTTYDGLKAYSIEQKDQEGVGLKAIKFFGVGFIAGMSAQIITYPLDTARRRLQINGGLGINNQYNGNIDVLKQMYLQEGIKSFYGGLFVSLIKIAPAAAIQFSIYDIFKNSIFE